MFDKLARLFIAALIEAINSLLLDAHDTVKKPLETE